MSRIEEAMRRARNLDRSAVDGQEAAHGPKGPAWSAEDPSDSPWQFDAARRPQAPAPLNGRVVPHRPTPQPTHGADAAPSDPCRGPHLRWHRQSLGARFVGSSEIPPLSVEQYRRLAATLHHTQPERGIKVVMITSALSGEGKSLTSANLALTLSQSYRRDVLLIDGDLRRPSIHHIFQVQNASGLSDGLKSSDEKLSIIEVFEHLAILTAGKPDPDPMSGLTSDRMRRIVDEAPRSSTG